MPSDQCRLRQRGDAVRSTQPTNILLTYHRSECDIPSDQEPKQARFTRGTGNMSALDALGDANALASAQAARTGQAAQVANIAGRLERLPLTSYQKGIFVIIATAWFFDSMDL